MIAGIMQALITVNNPLYEPRRWVETLLMMMVVILMSLFNAFAASNLTFVEGMFATCHVFAFVPVCITLWVMVTPKTSATDVFVNFRDHTGAWPNAGVSVLVGQITGIFTTIGSDALGHLAEEVESAATVVPRGMVLG